MPLEFYDKDYGSNYDTSIVAKKEEDSFCNKGLLHTFISPLFGAVVFGEILFYIVKLLTQAIANFINYTFPDNYWNIINTFLPAVTLAFFSMIMQKYGNLPNMFKTKILPDELQKKINNGKPIEFSNIPEPKMPIDFNPTTIIKPIEF